MQHAERCRIGTTPGDVHEMDAEAVHIRFVMGVLVDFRFLFAPVKIVDPIVDQTFHVLGIGPIVPSLLGE